MAGDGLQVVELSGAIRLGVDRQGTGAYAAGDEFDILITTAPEAPAPWVSVAPVELNGLMADLAAPAARTPVAAAVMAQVLRLGAHLPFDEALILESLAYSMLLAGAEFRAWRAACGGRRGGALAAGCLLQPGGAGRMVGQPQLPDGARAGRLDRGESAA